VIEFVKRCVVVKADYGQRRIWRSRCGKYRVTQSVFDCKAIRPVWRAMVLVTEANGYKTWTFVDRHQQEYRHRGTAEKAIQRHAKDNGG
jgi:hypothetical protein